jgi:F-type H+-transporting ATPase subunit delta
VRGGVVARRYAKALVEVAAAVQALERVGQDLKACGALLREQTELVHFFSVPGVLPSAKRQAAEEIARRMRLHEISQRLFNLVAERGRVDLLDAIREAYEALVDERLGRVRAVVRTATPLSRQQTAALRASLEQAEGKTVYLEVSVDPALRAGIVTQIGSMVYDGSLGARLQMCREHLLKGAPH